MLPSGDSDIRGAIMTIGKTSTILKRTVNKLLPIENTYQDTNQKNKAKEQKLRIEVAIFGELKRKYQC